MADPSMVTDDLIRTRQMIFQQPDWPRGLRDEQVCRTSRPASATCSPTTTCAPSTRAGVVDHQGPSGPVDEAKRIASLIPHAQLAVMDNCGTGPSTRTPRRSTRSTSTSCSAEASERGERS